MAPTFSGIFFGSADLPGTTGATGAAGGITAPPQPCGAAAVPHPPQHSLLSQQPQILSLHLCSQHLIFEQQDSALQQIFSQQQDLPPQLPFMPLSQQNDLPQQSLL
jgi:hypothetical protein